MCTYSTEIYNFLHVKSCLKNTDSQSQQQNGLLSFPEKLSRYLLLWSFSSFLLWFISGMYTYVTDSLIQHSNFSTFFYFFKPSCTVHSCNLYGFLLFCTVIFIFNYFSLNGFLLKSLNELSWWSRKSQCVEKKQTSSWKVLWCGIYRGNSLFSQNSCINTMHQHFP